LFVYLTRLLDKSEFMTNILLILFFSLKSLCLLMYHSFTQNSFDSHIYFHVRSIFSTSVSKSCKPL